MEEKLKKGKIARKKDEENIIKQLRKQKESIRGKSVSELAQNPLTSIQDILDAQYLIPQDSAEKQLFVNQLLFAISQGKIPYPITIRSFAPFKTFGGGFHGDNRGFSTNSKSSARVHQIIDFDTDKNTIQTEAWSSPTWHKLNPNFTRTAKPSVEFTKDFTLESNKDTKTFNFGTHYSGSNPLTPGAPNIDVFSDFSIIENKNAKTLDISGKLNGDNFPSTEVFITDPSGKNVFIGVGLYEGSPFSSLWGENEKKIITEFNFSITTDDKGNFTGVKIQDLSFTIDQWNAFFENINPHEKAKTKSEKTN